MLYTCSCLGGWIILVAAQKEQLQKFSLCSSYCFSEGWERMCKQLLRVPISPTLAVDSVKLKCWSWILLKDYYADGSSSYVLFGTELKGISRHCLDTSHKVSGRSCCGFQTTVVPSKQLNCVEFGNFWLKYFSFRMKSILSGSLLSKVIGSGIQYPTWNT